MTLKAEIHSLQTSCMHTEEYVIKLNSKTNDRAPAEILPEGNMKLNEPKLVLQTPRMNNMKVTYKDAKLDQDAPERPPYHEAHLIISSPIVSQTPKGQYTDFDVQR